MKDLFTFVISLFFASGFLQGQTWAIKLQAGRYYPSLTHIEGDFPNCAFLLSHKNFPDIGMEYRRRSGLIFSATLGYQVDWYNFSEIASVHTYGGPLSFAKTYKSIPFIISSGYSYRISKSNFWINALAGIGFGLLRSDDVTKQYAFDGFVAVTDFQGQHIDSQHVLINVVDLPMKKPVAQARVSFALEYRMKNLFIRSFFETRTWLSRFEEIKYHSENSSSYHQYTQTVDGHFSVRTEYLGIGLGIGWYFKDKES